jgi:hypothetical protein
MSNLMKKKIFEPESAHPERRLLRQDCRLEQLHGRGS